MKKFFAFLQMHDHIKDNSALGLSPPKLPKEETRFLTEAELDVVFNALAENNHSTNGLRDIVIISLMAITGLRKSSVVNLNIEDFNETCNTLTVQEKGLPGKRPVQIPSVVSALLNEFVGRRAIKEGPLFLNRKKQRLAPDGINKIVNPLKERLIEKGRQFAKTLHPHIFRHTCATMLNEKGAKILTIQNILGHSNPNTTINYYLHTPQHVMRAALEKLPLTLFLNQLIEDGKIQLTYQKKMYKNTG